MTPPNEASVTLDALEKLAREATPGPWWNESGTIHAKNPGVWTEDNHSCTHPAHASDETGADAAYIAAASPDVILSLCAELRRFRGALERIAVVYDTDDFDCAVLDCPYVIRVVDVVEIARNALEGTK